MKKRRLEKVRLNLSTEEHYEYTEMKEVIAYAVTLTHRDPTKGLHLTTDASGNAWEVVLTQAPPADLGESVLAMTHEPLAFLSGFFKGPQMKWSTIEKESYARAWDYA